MIVSNPWSTVPEVMADVEALETILQDSVTSFPGFLLGISGSLRRRRRNNRSRSLDTFRN